MRRTLLLVLGCLLLACSPLRGAGTPSTAVIVPEPEPIAAEPTALAAGESPDAAPHLPVYPEDGSWGDPLARVTIIAFLDLQCPFCARVHPTLQELKERYGPKRLRLVVKHNPLPFHDWADEAALHAVRIRQARGHEAFFRFVETVLSEQAAIREAGEGSRVTRLEEIASRFGSSNTRSDSEALRVQIERDQALARTVGATGTPSFFINGLRLTGAQPIDKFIELIDREIAATAELVREGVPARSIYRARVADNFAVPEPAEPVVDEPDDTVWKVPVGSSPVLGPSDALVTIVEFSDYECPFCKRVQPTLERVRKQYGSDVRFVFKHNPLPFHQRAKPAALFSIEARRQRGDAAFWDASHRLFEADSLEEPVLEAIAVQMKLNVIRMKDAIAKETGASVIDQDQKLAQDTSARGTPSFFINGRLLRGAQPFEAFEASIDEALADAKQRVAAGTPRNKVYEVIQKDAKGPPPPPMKSLGSPAPSGPATGPAKAPVTVHVFGDFQCPFCARVQPTLKALTQKYPKDVRLVFHHLPLDFHQRAMPAARAAMEAYAQRGDQGFWQMHDRLYQNTQLLEYPDLVAHARAVGLDVARFEAALSDGRHDAAIQRDKQIGSSADIRGTPAFVINGYFLSGAQPLPAFEKLVDRALDDVKNGRRIGP